MPVISVTPGESRLAGVEYCWKQSSCGPALPASVLPVQLGLLGRGTVRREQDIFTLSKVEAGRELWCPGASQEVG